MAAESNSGVTSQGYIQIIINMTSFLSTASSIIFAIFYRLLFMLYYVSNLISQTFNLNG